MLFALNVKENKNVVALKITSNRDRLVEIPLV